MSHSTDKNAWHHRFTAQLHGCYVLHSSLLSALYIYSLASWLACFTFFSAPHFYSLASYLACFTFLSASQFYSLASWLACFTFLSASQFYSLASWLACFTFMHLAKTACIHLFIHSFIAHSCEISIGTFLRLVHVLQ